MREPKKLVLRKVKQKGYYRKIKDKNGKIIGKTWIEPGKVNRLVVSNAWKKWRLEEDKRIAQIEYVKAFHIQINRWRTGWLRAEFRDSKTGQKFYYKNVLTFKQFINMRKREERIDSYNIKPKKKVYIKFKSDKQAIQEARKLLEIAKWKSERIKMSPEFNKWVHMFSPPK